MIHVVEYTPHPSRRQSLCMEIALCRAVARGAGAECDASITAAIAAANGLHLRTAYRRVRRAWSAWSICWMAEMALRQAEAELAAMEAS